ncbi:ATP-NAD kinase [Punctularia strigosozonata HHB-11173 SS5]|uniref:ATP-NAD kinase n=1 Tax=Punctularia strigosozonata (strain HHB-11173) TaxID=741275 RepID=UPI00044186E0|nr:ATP-NAD kinase [Punctularia strigosozonata HHB-11173 SS5]EIN11943.1 ATP-NAD kinase [Punctularia strigosozonata HHB-11173 SS5]
MPMPGSLFSPATEGFHSPPVTPGAVSPPKSNANTILKPSLSRKNSRPSNLSIARSGSAEWNPDIVLEESSPNVDPRSAQSATPQPTPVYGDTRALPHPIPADITVSPADPQRGSKVDHLAALKSPCFVHSNLDKGASLADWLKGKHHDHKTNGRGRGGMAHHQNDDAINVAKSLNGHPHAPHHHYQKPASGILQHNGHSPESYPSSSPEQEDYSEDEYGDSLTKQLAATAVGVREMSKELGRARIHSKFQNVLIVTKAKDNRLIKLTRELALYLMLKKRQGQDRGLVVYVDTQLRKSRRFDAAGIEQEHPELFTPMPRRRSSSSTSLASMSSASSNGEYLAKEQGQLRYWTADMCSRQPHLFDFVITLGGDGTVLFTSWLFQRIVPPVLPFALGSLGFLTNFDFADHQNVMDSVIDSGIRVNLRMRFTCTVYRAVIPCEGEKSKVRAVKKAQTGEIMMKDLERGGWEALEAGYPPEGIAGPKDKEIMCFTTRPVESFEVLNDLVVDRGPSPYVSQLELFADEHHLTTVQADGLCIATPTGSTAYSLSAGGSLVHPEIPAILITPLCPHTLSFRPMLLPDSMELRICVPFNSRSTAWVSFDGRGRVELKQGDHIKVSASKYPFPTVCADKSSTDWFHSISRTLKWNERERQKSFVVVEENPKPRKKAVPGGTEALEEEDEEDEEEDDKFDIDDLSTSEDDAKDTLDASLLKPEEKKLGQDKVSDFAAGKDERARAAANAIAGDNPFVRLQQHPSGLHSGIDTPDRFMGPHPHPPPVSARHVAFAQAVSGASSSSSLNGGYHSPRAVYPGHDSAEMEREMNAKTPTVSDIRKGATHKHTRSRSRSKDPANGKAFAVWGQDESESESNASDTDLA